jgi:hypothetical protein
MIPIAVITAIAAAVEEIFKFLQTTEGQAALKEGRINWAELIANIKGGADWFEKAFKDTQ